MDEFERELDESEGEIIICSALQENGHRCADQGFYLIDDESLINQPIGSSLEQHYGTVLCEKHLFLALLGETKVYGETCYEDSPFLAEEEYRCSALEGHGWRCATQGICVIDNDLLENYPSGTSFEQHFKTCLCPRHFELGLLGKTECCSKLCVPTIEPLPTPTLENNSICWDFTHRNR